MEKIGVLADTEEDLRKMNDFKEPGGQPEDKSVELMEIIKRQEKQLRTQAEELKAFKESNYVSMTEMTRDWGPLKKRFRNVKSKFGDISEQSQNPNAKRARKIFEMLQQQQRPLILIPVTGPKENGKTGLLNAILGGSIVHNKRMNYQFPIYVEHVPGLHLYCENEPCKFCPRLEKSNDEVLATGLTNVLAKQGKLEVPEKGIFYIIKTNIPMLENIPDDFPFTVYLADCPGDNIYQIAKDFDLSAVLTPAVICAVSTKKFMKDKDATLVSAEQSLQFTYMADDLYLNRAHVLFAATFCEDYMYSEDESPSQMKDELKDLRLVSSYYPVAAKWARKAREYMNEPEKQGLYHTHMKVAWKWVQRKEVVKNWINPDKVVSLAIGRFEDGIKQSIASLNIREWVSSLERLSEKMNPKLESQRDSSSPKVE